VFDVLHLITLIRTDVVLTPGRAHSLATFLYETQYVAEKKRSTKKFPIKFTIKRTLFDSIVFTFFILKKMEYDPLPFIDGTYRLGLFLKGRDFFYVPKGEGEEWGIGQWRAART